MSYLYLTWYHYIKLNFQLPGLFTQFVLLWHVEVQQSIPVGPLSQLSLPQSSVPSQSAWKSQSPSLIAHGKALLQFDQAVLYESNRHILVWTLHSWLSQSVSAWHVEVQQSDIVLFMQFMCPQTSDSSHSVSSSQSPWPAPQRVLAQISFSS